MLIDEVKEVSNGEVRRETNNIQISNHPNRKFNQDLDCQYKKHKNFHKHSTFKTDEFHSFSLALQKSPGTI